MKNGELEALYLQAREIEEKTENDRQKAESELMDRLWKLITVCGQGFIEHPIGFFAKRCPMCGEKLRRVYPHVDYDYRVCDCGYEWARCCIGDAD